MLLLSTDLPWENLLLLSTDLPWEKNLLPLFTVLPRAGRAVG